MRNTNSRTSLFLFWPGSTPQAEITQGPKIEGVGDTWAVIAWTTDTGGSTIVRYGTNPNSLNETAQAPYADNERT